MELGDKPGYFIYLQTCAFQWCKNLGCSETLSKSKVERGQNLVDKKNEHNGSKDAKPTHTNTIWRNVSWSLNHQWRNRTRKGLPIKSYNGTIETNCSDGWARRTRFDLLGGGRGWTAAQGAEPRSSQTTPHDNQIDRAVGGTTGADGWESIGGAVAGIAGKLLEWRQAWAGWV